MPEHPCASVQNGLFGFGKGRIIKGSYFAKHHLETIRKTFDRLVELTTEEHQTVIVLEHVPLKKVLSVPNGTTAFYRRDTFNMALFVTWSNITPENLVIARRITRELNGIFVAGQVEEFGHVNHGYGNIDIDVSDSDKSLSDLTSAPEILFGNNYPRLQEIKKHYDPDNVFSKWFAITPAQ